MFRRFGSFGGFRLGRDMVLGKKFVFGSRVDGGRKGFVGRRRERRKYGGF